MKPYTEKELREMGISSWPNNDGGYWYFDPRSGLVVNVY